MPDSFSFTLNNIKENVFFLQAPKNVAAPDQEPDFSITNRIAIEPDNALVVVTMEVSIQQVAAEPQGQLARLLQYEATFNFTVQGIDFTPQQDPGSEESFVTLPIQISAVLVGTAYSTCRGILFARTAGSGLSNYLLPIVNTVKLVEGMANKFRMMRPEEQDNSKEISVVTPSRDFTPVAQLESKVRRKPSKAVE